jgi:hypothetical protein
MGDIWRSYEMRTLVYVAGPYSDPNPFYIASNIRRAEEASIRLVREGYDVITPHKNTAGYEKYADIGYDYWLEMCLNILARCDVLYVMKGSELSKGVAKEIVFAHQCGIPVVFEASGEEKKMKRKWEWLRDYCMENKFLRAAELADKIDRVLCYLYKEEHTPAWVGFIKHEDKTKFWDSEEVLCEIVDNPDYCIACAGVHNCNGCKFSRATGACCEGSLFGEFEDMFDSETDGRGTLDK